jgi:chromosome partitioning protein
MKDDIEKTVYEVMLQEIGLPDAVIKNIFDNLDIVPSNVNLAGAEIDLIDFENREYILKNEINKVKEQ